MDKYTTQQCATPWYVMRAAGADQLCAILSCAAAIAVFGPLADRTDQGALRLLVHFSTVSRLSPCPVSRAWAHARRKRAGSHDSRASTLYTVPAMREIWARRHSSCFSGEAASSSKHREIGSFGALTQPNRCFRPPTSQPSRPRHQQLRSPDCPSSCWRHLLCNNNESSAFVLHVYRCRHRRSFLPPSRQCGLSFFASAMRQARAHGLFVSHD
jgi:hypothetical protein